MVFLVIFSVFVIDFLFVCVKCLILVVSFGFFFVIVVLGYEIELLGFFGWLLYIMICCMFVVLVNLNVNVLSFLLFIKGEYIWFSNVWFVLLECMLIKKFVLLINFLVSNFVICFVGVLLMFFGNFWFRFFLFLGFNVILFVWNLFKFVKCNIINILFIFLGFMFCCSCCNVYIDGNLLLWILVVSNNIGLLFFLLIIVIGKVMLFFLVRYDVFCFVFVVIFINL